MSAQAGMVAHAGSLGKWQLVMVAAAIGTQVKVQLEGHAREEDACVVNGLEQQEDEHQQVEDAGSSYNPPKHWVRPERHRGFKPITK